MDQVKSSLGKAELAAVYIAYALRYVYPLVLLPFYGRTLGPAGYGVVLAAMSLSNSIWLFVSFGFPTIGARDTVHAHHESERAAILSSQMTGRLLLCIPAAIIGTFAVCLSPALSGRPLVGVTTIVLGLLAAFNIGWYFTSTGRARRSVLIEVVGFVLSLALIFGFIHQPDDLGRVLPLLLLSCVVQLALAYGCIRQEFTGWLASIGAGVELIKRSKVIFIYTGTSVLLISASTYLLSVLAPASEVSAFGVAERLIAAGLSLMGPAAQILVPKVTYLVGENPSRANQLARRILTFFLLGALVAVLAVLTLSDWLVPLVFGQGFQQTVPVLKLFALVLPLSVVNQVIGLYFLIPRNMEALLARAGVASAIANILLAIPLASHWGAIGMVGARLLGELLLLIVLVLGVCRHGLFAVIFKPEQNTALLRMREEG